MAETKLEYAALARPITKILCKCESPSVELHLAQQVYMECTKCGKPYTKGMSHKEAHKYQDDAICV
jgi:hypothetical protein